MFSTPVGVFVLHLLNSIIFSQLHEQKQNKHEFLVQSMEEMRINH
jgi:hypothetical protein